MASLQTRLNYACTTIVLWQREGVGAFLTKPDADPIRPHGICTAGIGSVGFTAYAADTGVSAETAAIMAIMGANSRMILW